MALDFTDTATESFGNGVKLLVHAPAGMGKTMLNATLPKPIVISAEAGLLSLSRGNIIRVFGADREDINYNMPVIKVRNIQDLEDAYAWCIGSAEAVDYETISLDSITEIMEQILSHAKSVHKDPRAAYGDLGTEGEKLIRAFRDIEGKNVYMSAKMGKFNDEAANVTKYGPMMPGQKLGVALPYFFDEMYTMRIGSDENGTFRYLQTQPDIQYEAKSRSGALEVMEDPHIGNLIAKIKAYSQANAEEYVDVYAAAGGEGEFVGE